MIVATSKLDGTKTDLEGDLLDSVIADANQRIDDCLGDEL